MTKEQILKAAKDRGVKLSYLNDLIGGYRGKLTDWKNSKTTLTDAEISIIINYLFERDKNLDEQLQGIDFALQSESKELTNEEKQDVLDYVKFLKSKRSDNKK